MNLRILLTSLLVLLSACGGGSSSGGSGGTLGRCEFTVDSNNVPQVSISVSTGDQSIGQMIQSDCGRVLTELRNLVRNCLTSPTTPEMYPVVSLSRNDNYIVDFSGSGGSVLVAREAGITSENLPRNVVNTVQILWMHENGFTSSLGCGSYIK